MTWHLYSAALVILFHLQRWRKQSNDNPFVKNGSLAALVFQIKDFCAAENFQISSIKVQQQSIYLSYNFYSCSLPYILII